MGTDRPLSRIGVIAGALLLAVAVDQPQAQQLPTAARLLGNGSAPLPPPLVVGGGEVVLDVVVASNGSVVDVRAVRATPPYADLLASAVRRWRFEPATTVAGAELKASPGHVLVMGVYRPPQVYVDPARGEPTSTVGELAPELPPPGVLTMPEAYPPRAVRSGAVLIEIELTAAGVARGYRVLGPASPFDSAALETVRLWRFGIPSAPAGAEQVFAYAVVGFAEPVTR